MKKSARLVLIVSINSVSLGAIQRFPGTDITNQKEIF